MFVVTGDFPVRSVAIFRLWLMILVNTVLVRCTSSFVGSSKGVFISCVLVDLRLFHVWYMWHVAVTIDWGSFLFIMSIIKYVHVEKYPFLIAWMGVYLTGLNSVA